MVKKSNMKKKLYKKIIYTTVAISAICLLINVLKEPTVNFISSFLLTP